jgi:hypothetical protein
MHNPRCEGDHCFRTSGVRVFVEDGERIHYCLYCYKKYKRHLTKYKTLRILRGLEIPGKVEDVLAKEREIKINRMRKHLGAIM